MDVEPLVRPLVEDEGFELVDVAFAVDDGRRILRVTVDRTDGPDLDTVADLSLKLSHRLDDVDFGTGPYALEVSSPGIERRLRSPAQYARSTGERIKVRTIAEPGSRPAIHTGALLETDDEGILLLDGGERVRVTYGEIASASTVADWDAELKRSHT